MHKIKYFSAVLFIFLLSGCAVTQNYNALQNMMKADDCQNAVSYMEQSGDEYSSNSKLLFLLDSAMINMQCGNYGKANSFFHEAEVLAQQLWTTSISREAASFVTNDLVTSYAGEDFERVLINVLSAISYLMAGQKDEALVECRKVDSLLSMYNSKYGNKKNVYKEDAFARYLSAIIYESENDFDDAYIDYANSYRIFKDWQKLYSAKIPETLFDGLFRTATAVDRIGDAKRLTGKSYDLKKDLLSDLKTKARLVIIHLNGTAPVKIERIFNVHTDRGFWVSIAFPEYRKTRPYCKTSEFKAVGENGKNIDVETFLAEDVTKIAIKALEDRRLRMWTKAVARAIIKYQGIKKLAGDGENRDFIAMGLNLFNNIALERADTRCWRTLPGNIYISSIFIDPGKYKIFMDQSGNNKFIKEVELKPGTTEFATVFTIY